MKMILWVNKLVSFICKNPCSIFSRMASREGKIPEDTAGYQRAITNDLGAEENSNEAIVQFGFNTEKSTAATVGKTGRTDITKWERSNIMNNPYARRVMKQLKLFRKRKVVLGIVHDYMKNEQFITYLYSPDQHPTIVINRPGTTDLEIIDHTAMPDSPASPLCSWFREFLKNLTNERADYNFADEANQYDLIATYLRRPEYKSILDIQKRIDGMAQAAIARYRMATFGTSEIHKHPVYAFIELVNYLCVGYAHIHHISFALIKNTKSNNNRFEAKSIENQFHMSERNKRSKKHHEKKSIHFSAWDTRKIVLSSIVRESRNPAPSSSDELPADLLFLIENSLFEGTSGQAGRNYDEFEEEPEAEEGWREAAPEVLLRNGLDPANYIRDYVPGEELAQPKQPSSSSSSQTPAENEGEENLPTPNIHEEVGEDNTPTLNVASYEELSRDIHNHPVVDTHDVLDAVDTGLNDFEEQEEAPDILDGGHFMVPPEAFSSTILELVAPNIVTAYNAPPEIHEEHVEDVLPPRVETPPLVFPTVGEILMHGDREPIRGPVHSNPITCSKVADKFVIYWRAAKRLAYRHKKFKHFPINRAFFQAGAICHRCYQLVRSHQEKYHLKNGGTVRNKVWRYPRGRLVSQMKKMAATPKDTRKYKTTKAGAKKKYKEYKDLLGKSPKEAKAYATRKR